MEHSFGAWEVVVVGRKVLQLLAGRSVGMDDTEIGLVGIGETSCKRAVACFRSSVDIEVGFDPSSLERRRFQDSTLQTPSGQNFQTALEMYEYAEEREVNGEEGIFENLRSIEGS